ncbi:MAG: class I SAM-dependent methyltransferase, partial [Comamonadaceae bacterium]
MSRDPLWEDIFATRPWGKYPAEEFIRFLAGNFYRRDPRHGVRVLEVGFGIGANLWYAAREGFCVHGIEGAQAGRDRAVQRLDAEVPGWRDHGADLRVGDICEPLPYADAGFDAVVDSDAVTCNGHEEACRVYAEMHRVTRPGGLMYIRTPATGCWGEG